MGHSHRFGPASFTSDLPQLADIPSSVACSKVLLADLGCVRASAIRSGLNGVQLTRL